MLAWILALIGSFVGSALSAICGFGIGIFMMIVLPYAIAPYSASCTVGLVSIIQAAWLAWIYRKKIRIKSAIPPLIAYFIITLLIVPKIKNLSNDSLRTILGIFLLIIGIYFIFFNGKLKIKATPVNGFIAGVIGSVMGSMFSVAGPPMSLYFGSALDGKEEYIATMQFYFCITNIYLSTLRFINGYIDKTVLICLVWAIIGMLGGTLLGKKIFSRLNADGVKKCSYALILISGLVMIIL